MNTQDLIELYLQQQLNNQKSPSNTINGYANRLNSAINFGNNLQTAGNYLKGVNNKVLNGLGTGMSKAGGFIQNGASAIKNVPQNVFNGFAQPTNPAIEGAISDVLGSSVGAEAGGALAGGASAGAGASAGGASGAMAGGPIGALVALGAMALQGTNRNRAKQSGENLMKQTNQMANATENDTSVQNFANQMVKQAQGNITGGASPVEPDVLGLDNEMSQLGYTPQQKMSAMNGLNGGDKVIANLIDKYNIQKPQADVPVEAPVEAPVDNIDVQTGGIEETKQGLLSKLMSGLGDFAQGYKENRNNGYSPENFDRNRFAETTTTYTPNQQLVDYQNSLRNNEDFIKWANNAQKDKEAVLNDIANGKNGGYAPIDEWIKANPDALKPVANTVTTYTGKEKGKMARFGEGIGTIARALQNPNFQGIVAGGLGTALTGNPLYGLGLGYKFANKRAMNDVYQEALKQQGIDTNVGTFGNLGKDDFSALMTPQYKNAIIENTKAYRDALIDNRNARLELDRIKAENDKNHKATQDKIAQQNADARTTTANARTTSANASWVRANQPKATGGKGSGSGKGGNKNTSSKPQQHPDWNKDLAGYIQRLNDPRYATKIGQLKAGFINKYGVDPDKYIKD